MIKDTKPAKQSATKDITKATFECSPSYTYTGKAITPVEVSYGGKKLTEDKDYEINYVKNTAVGTATATVTGIGDYEGRRVLPSKSPKQKTRWRFHHRITNLLLRP